ncbi:MAG: ATP-binding protein [Treponema sp.]|nr:ATP-binding protein [Treponema sp.]
MRFFFRKLHKFFSGYAQALLVLIVFALMVASSYYYVSRAERSHLRREAYNAILFAETNIIMKIQEARTLLGGISETIRSMVILGESSDAVGNFLGFINNYVQNNNGEDLSGAVAFYGFFDVYNGAFLTGSDDWEMPDGFNPVNRPWYSGAVSAAGSIAVSDPYISAYTGRTSITISRRIFNGDGTALGIICYELKLDKITQQAVDARLTESGYGFLVNDNYDIIAHPNSGFMGVPFKEANNGIFLQFDEFMKTGYVTEATTTNYNGDNSITFFKELQNGWFMGLVTPRDDYFESSRTIFFILAALGVFFAFLLILMLFRYAREKDRLDRQIKIVNEQHSRLLDTVNKAAAILLTNDDREEFETALLKCFDLIGHCLDIDRVQIWRNEIIDKEPHFILGYEWLSDYGKECNSIPGDLDFPRMMKKKWGIHFLRGKYINALVRELPQDNQSFLNQYNIKTIVILPMFLAGEFWGFFSICDCRKERKLSDEEISILTSAGLMMSSAVNRNMQTVKMRESEERTQIMLDAAPLCTIFWDSSLKLIDCNQEAVNMFGLSGKNELLEKFITLSPEFQPDGIPSGEKGSMLIRKALDEGYSRFEWMHQKEDGVPIPADITCIRVKYKGEFTVTEYIRDLREQKAMVKEMRKAEIAEESSKAKSDFLARMSHEIRTPMNAILGITEIQLQDETHPQITHEAFERIYSSGSLLLGIINDILDLSKIEAGKLILNPVKYDIASLIHDSVQLIIMRYESKPIEFVLKVNENIPLTLIGDELRIKQILNNILSNAFKYTQEGTVTLSVYPESLSDTDNNSIVNLIFIIRDTGQGMTQEQIKKLGTEYARFNMEANRNTEGAGLGMNITQNLIHLMNGSFSVDSTPGKGSVFTICLPQQFIGSSIIGAELADNLMQLNLDNKLRIHSLQMKREYMPYGRVLIVDDVETNLYVARGLMAPYGLSIETVVSGFDAIDKIREGSQYDIIFMDHMMPRMDGIEAVKIIRNLGYTQPIIALTANALTGQSQIFLDNGFDDFISKPIDLRQLNLVLNKFIRDKYPSEVLEMASRIKNNMLTHNEKKHIVDHQLAEVFVRDARKSLDVLEAIYCNKCRRADDLSVFIINIHSMKSALANIGEENLAADALRLEQAGREQNVNMVLNELPSFLELLGLIIDRLEPMDEAVTENTVSGNNQYLKENLLSIKKACELLDKKSAKDILKETRQMKWSFKTKKQLSDIAEFLLHSEFDEAVKSIDDYLKQI